MLCLLKGPGYDVRVSNQKQIWIMGFVDLFEGINFWFGKVCGVNSENKKIFHSSVFIYIYLFNCEPFLCWALSGRALFRFFYRKTHYVGTYLNLISTREFLLPFICKNQLGTIICAFSIYLCIENNPILKFGNNIWWTQSPWKQYVRTEKINHRPEPKPNKCLYLRTNLCNARVHTCASMKEGVNLQRKAI